MDKRKDLLFLIFLGLLFLIFLLQKITSLSSLPVELIKENKFHEHIIRDKKVSLISSTARLDNDVIFLFPILRFQFSNLSKRKNLLK